jgi:hypothetical protein
VGGAVKIFAAAGEKILKITIFLRKFSKNCLPKKSGDLFLFFFGLHFCKNYEN